jgi:hypothetical protein
MDKETIVTSHWKTVTCGLGMAALLLCGCQKSENAGTPGGASGTAASGTSAGTTTPASSLGDTSKPPFGFLDTPKEGATVAAGSWAYGWALDDSGIAQVTVVTDAGTTSPVALNQPFPGVAQLHPDFANADKAGFGFPMPKLDPGIHTVTVTLVARDGGTTEIRRQVRIK